MPSNSSELKSKFKNQRLVLAAKEAGAGALLAALLEQWQCSQCSVAIVSTTAAPYFKNTAIRVVADDLSDVQLSELLSQVKPDHVVVGASGGDCIEKRVLTSAQTLGLQVSAFIDHYWNLWQRFAHPQSATPWHYKPNTIYVPSQNCVERLATSGFAASNIQVFEHPLLQPAATARTPQAQQLVRRKLNVPEQAMAVVFVSEHLFTPDPLWNWEQPTTQDFHELLTLLLSISARNDFARPLHVIVRPHPSEPANRWDKLCNNVPGAKWCNGAHLTKADLFAVADLAFGLNSMLLLEMSASGLPVYSLHFQVSYADTWLSTIRTEVVEIANQSMCRTLFESICVAH